MKVIFLAVWFLLFSSTAFAQSTPSLEDALVKDGLSAVLDAIGPGVDNPRVTALAARLNLSDVIIVVSEFDLAGEAGYFPGYIFIGRRTANLPDAQLAFVLAHEYGHHLRQHWRVHLSRGVAAALQAGVVVKTSADVSEYIWQEKSREVSHAHELQADADALLRIKEAGLYDEEQLIAFFRSFPDEGESHPSATVRIAELKKWSGSPAPADDSVFALASR